MSAAADGGRRTSIFAATTTGTAAGHEGGKSFGGTPRGSGDFCGMLSSPPALREGCVPSCGGNGKGNLLQFVVGASGPTFGIAGQRVGVGTRPRISLTCRPNILANDHHPGRPKDHPAPVVNCAPHMQPQHGGKCAAGRNDLNMNPAIFLMSRCALVVKRRMPETWTWPTALLQGILGITRKLKACSRNGEAAE